MRSTKKGQILNNNIYTRKNLRLQDYDYTLGGYYFITICTKDKNHYFGEISKEMIQLNDVGKIAFNSIEKIREIYKSIKIDNFVVMPNHIHMIIIIDTKTEVSISRVIKQYKEYITKQIGMSIWQKSFYDHIIRDEKDYLRIWKYIDENILKWNLDMFYNE